MKSILLVNDENEFPRVFAKMIEHIGGDLSLSNSVEDAKQWIDLNSFDHVFVDFMLPDGSGLQVIEYLRMRQKSVPVTLLTRNIEIRNAILTISGAEVNCLMKPVELHEIEAVLGTKRSATMGGHKDTVLRNTSEPVKHFGCIIGESTAMQELYTKIERVARTDANVMLIGESGVGKDLVARAIHNASKVKGKFIATNCGGLSKELIGSQLFGHEKGSFTGAVGQKPGVFELAHNGTLLLDEISEMPIDMQPNLLRVLETMKVSRVGGTQEFKVSCRVISATNRKLDELAREEIMREDIYYRLAVFPIHIPPLRERKSDIALLANAYLDSLNQQHNERFKLTQTQMDRLIEHQWPGNVRELNHSLHQAFIMSEPGATMLNLPAQFESPFSQSHTSSLGVEAGKTIDEIERELIYATLAEVDNNKTAAAEALGISTKTLYNRLHAYGEEL